MDSFTILLVATWVMSAGAWWEAYSMRRFFENNVILVHLKEGDLDGSKFN